MHVNLSLKKRKKRQLKRSAVNHYSRGKRRSCCSLRVILTRFMVFLLHPHSLFAAFRDLQRAIYFFHGICIYTCILWSSRVVKEKKGFAWAGCDSFVSVTALRTCLCIWLDFTPFWCSTCGWITCILKSVKFQSRETFYKTWV